MAYRAPTICGAPGCPRLAPCPDHPKRPAFSGRTGSATRHGYPSDWSARRSAVLREETHCRQCGAPLRFGYRPGSPAVVDHIVPLTQGGTHERHNLQALCDRCSKQKTAREGHEARRARRGAA